MSRQIVTQEGEKVFDSRVHHVDPKTGKLTKKTPYSLKVVNGQQIFIDTNTGRKYYPNGEEVKEEPKPAPAAQQASAPKAAKLEPKALQDSVSKPSFSDV